MSILRSFHQVSTVRGYFQITAVLGFAIAMNGCERRQTMQSDGNDAIIGVVLKEYTTQLENVPLLVVVLQPETGDDLYCLVPPFGRNPFGSTLEDLKSSAVKLYDSIQDLSNAIRDTAPSQSVKVGHPDSFESRHKLRALTKQEFDEIRRLVGR